MSRNTYMRDYYAQPKNKEKMKQRMKDRRDRRRQLVYKIKLAIGCVDCGYVNEDYPQTLEFDHLPEHDKVGMVSSLLRGTVSDLMDEIEKCEVVCTNCHKIRTAQRLSAGI